MKILVSFDRIKWYEVEQDDFLTYFVSYFMFPGDSNGRHHLALHFNLKNYSYMCDARRANDITYCKHVYYR